MNPGAFVAGGGGDGGGAGGKGGKNGNGEEGAGTGDGDDDASGDGNDGGEGCGDPVCPITGRMFLDVYDFGFAGPNPLRWIRSYNSRTSNVDSELGLGWSHPFAFRLKQKRRKVLLVDHLGREQKLPHVEPGGAPITTALGWRYAIRGGVHRLKLSDGAELVFGEPKPNGWRYAEQFLDHNGNTTQILRDQKGHLSAMVDSAGRYYTVTTNPQGRIVRIAVATDPERRGQLTLVHYAYDDKGRLISATDAGGYDAAYIYAGTLMIAHRTPSGLTYKYRYDGKKPSAYCLETWGEYTHDDPALAAPIPQAPKGRQDTRKPKGIHYVSFTYSKDEYYCEAENGLGGVTRYFGDATGRVVRKVDPNGGVKDSYFHTECSDVVKQVNPDGGERSVERGARGVPSVVTLPDGKRIEYGFDEAGNHVRHEADTGAVLRRGFDRRNNLVYLEHPDGSRETFDYDPRGLMSHHSARNGATTSYKHDAMGNCVEIVEANGQVVRQEFDYLGRRTKLVNASGKATTWEYDQRSEVVRRVSPDGNETRVVYDANRKPITVYSGPRVMRFEWGGMGWLKSIVGADGARTEMRYDVEGNLVRVVNARGQTFEQQFDIANKCISVRTFEGIVHRAGYDAAGNVVWRESPLGIESREYAPGGDLLGAELPDGSTVALERDGLVLKISNPVVETEVEKDRAGQVIKDRQGEHRNHVTWVGGNVDRIQSDIGPDLEYQRRFDGRLEVLTCGPARVVFNQTAPGGETLTYLGQFLALRRRHNDAPRLEYVGLAKLTRGSTQQSLGTPNDAGLITSRVYRYDATQTLVEEIHDYAESIQYELNANRQVTVRRSVRDGQVTDEQRIQYDAAGSPRLPDVGYDALARPIALGDQTLDYDDCGNLVERKSPTDSWRYQWDGAGNLEKAFTPAGTVEFDHDSQGRRIRKRVIKDDVLVASVSYLWSNNTVLREHDELTGATRTYLRDDGAWEVLGHVDTDPSGNAKAYYYLTDPAGAIDMVVDEQGQTVWSGTHSVFGDWVPNPSELRIDSRFANQFDDPHVGLVYNNRRWYAPELAAYVSPDPLLLDGTLNPRDYVANPTTFIDPMGLGHVHPGVQPDPTTGAMPTQPPANGHSPRPDMPSTSDFADDGTYLLSPGHFATTGGPDASGNHVPGYAVAEGSVRTGSRTFPDDIRDTVDAAGRTHGCHSCGSKDPGTAHGHFIPDHQPPANQVRHAESRGMSVGEVRLYPHCLNCSRSQMRQANRGTQEHRAGLGVLGGLRNSSEANPGLAGLGPNIGPFGPMDDDWD